jgi:predicted solute-binding protein
LNLSVNEMQRYLKTNISYGMDDEKKKGMNLFMHLLRDKKRRNGFSVTRPFGKRVRQF